MTLPALDFAHLDVLRAFKKRVPRADAVGNVTPFGDQIGTALGGTAGCDLPEIHLGVREHIRETIEAVRSGRSTSQVVLLAGDAGTGKTHLLRTFQSADVAAEFGHVYVGGSNHWRIEEFQARLLDWMIESLTAPTPTEDHLLLDRVRAIGFRALDHLLASPVAWRTCLTRPGGRWIGRLVGRFQAPSHDRLKALAATRDVSVFRHLDFTAFGTYVCDRFLAERANPTHRYALRVLLTYLFPDRVETGVGTRERVLNWFRGRSDDGYFASRLGVADRLDRSFEQFEAVKLLAHLFSPAVSAQLSTEAHQCPPRVFLLTFDQAEGRNELFDSDDDWRVFFAHLSELYNSLPNVVVLFTMTLHLRTRLHGSMERQFRDRIRMDDRFVLRFPNREDIQRLYCARVESWIRDDDGLLTAYRALACPLVPFMQDELIRLGGNRTIRETLSEFDREFRVRLSELAVDALHDFLFYLNELRENEPSPQSGWEYTSDHLNTVARLLDLTADELTANRGLRLSKVESSWIDNVPVLKLWFNTGENSKQILIYLARVGRNFATQVENLCKELLYNREKVRHFLWVIRSYWADRKKDFDRVVPDAYETQVTFSDAPPAVESRFLALCHVAAKREKYEGTDQLRTYAEVLRSEVGTSYLDELLRTARAKLDALPQTADKVAVS